MTKEPNGGNAFPTTTADYIHSDGMTLRDWFAGQALAGMCAASANPNSDGPGSALGSYLSKRAYAYADAMIAERGL